jgi:MFS family permease
MDVDHHYAANIRKFYLYRALSSFLLWMPIVVIYLQQERGLSLTQVALIGSVSWIATALSEIPTGVVADRFGRKTSIVAGTILEVGAILLYSLAPTFPLLMLANIVWGISISFYSGAHEAFLYDTLVVQQRESAYTKIAGRAEAIAQISMAAGAIVGGFLASIDLTWPFLGTVALKIGVLGIALTLAEPPASTPIPSGPKPTYGETLQTAAQILQSQPILRYTLLYTSVLPIASFILSMILIQPHAVSLGVPIAALGLIVTGIRAATVSGSFAANTIAHHLSERSLLLVAPLLIVTSLLALGLVHSIWSLLYFAVVGFVTASVRPVLVGMIQRQLPGNVRATVMSIQSLFCTVLLAGMELMVGVIGDRFGLPATYLVMAGWISVIISVLLLALARVTSQPVLTQTTEV